MLTGRAENYLRGHPDLTSTIARLQAYQDAGADVLYAPGLTALDDIRQVVAGGRPTGERAGPPRRAAPWRSSPAVGVARISVGGALCFAALGAVVEAATELKEQGTYGFLERAAGGGQAARAAFAP